MDTFRIGEPQFDDFGLRADDLIEKLHKVPPGTPIIVRVGDRDYAINEIDDDLEEPPPEWHQLPRDEIVPVRLYLIAKECNK